MSAGNPSAQSTDDSAQVDWGSLGSSGQCAALWSLWQRERAFDAFYRMAGTAGTSSGLGLAIAQEAATRLGGKLGLTERSDGPGLVFSYRQMRQQT